MAIIESVTLNFTDLTGLKTGCTTLGSNKFWKGWVEDLGGDSANFECRWGPTGEAGSDKGSVRGTSVAAASAQLRKKVAEKEKKGYTRLDTRSDDEEIKKAAAKGVNLTNAPVAPVVAPAVGHTFHPEVGRLLGIIYGSTSNVIRAGLSAQAGATESNPIGNLSDRQLDLGGAILDEIGAFLDREIGTETPGNKNQTLPLRRDGTPDKDIINLTNRFMSNVPREISRSQRGAANLHQIIISSWERLEAQRTFLQLLRDAHISKGTFAAAAAATTTGGKEQVWYDGLQAMIELCETGSADFRKVVEIFTTAQSKKNSNWWRGSQPSVRVARVFKFTRNGTEARFNTYAETITRKPGAVGKIMAWHGTRTENLLGIGKAGLLMPENLPRGGGRVRTWDLPRAELSPCGDPGGWWNADRWAERGLQEPELHEPVGSCIWFGGRSVSIHVPARRGSRAPGCANGGLLGQAAPGWVAHQGLHLRVRRKEPGWFRPRRDRLLRSRRPNLPLFARDRNLLMGTDPTNVGEEVIHG